MKNIPSEKVFNVTDIPCSAKHGQVVQRCLDLGVGDYFVLVNTHDPVPLRSQLDAAFPESFLWEPVASDTPEFHLKITKLKPTDPSRTVSRNCPSHDGD